MLRQPWLRFILPLVRELLVSRPLPVVIALFLLSGAPIAAESPPATSRATTPSFSCHDLCGRLYGAEPENQALCEEGCRQAELCTKNCNARFADDPDKLWRCSHRCARPR